MGDRVYEMPGIQDQITYDVLAQRLLAGKGYSFPAGWYPFTPPETPTAHWSFLYPAWLASIYGIAGYHPLLARLLQTVFVGVAGSLLVYRLTKRLFGVRVALIATGLGAVYTYFVYYSAALMTEAFFMVAALAALELGYMITQKPTLLRTIALGVVLGIGILLRQTLLLFLPVLWLWLWRQNRRKIPWWQYVLILLIPVIFILPITLRNYATYGRFLLLNSNSGYVLYSSNHPNTGFDWAPSNSVNPIPEELYGLNEAELDARLTQMGIQFIVADPVRYLFLTLSKFKEYYKFWPSSEASLISNLQRPLSFGWLLPLALVGLYLARAQWRQWSLLMLFVFVVAALHLLTWPTARYRVPTDACLLPFAALTLYRLCQRIAGSPIPRTNHAHPVPDSLSRSRTYSRLQ